MAATTPFQPNVSGTTGLTVAVLPVTATGTGSVIPAIGTGGLGEASSVLVTNVGANTSYVRLSVETSTGAGASVTITDTPMPGNTVRLFADPNPVGPTGIGVITTVSGNTVYFTPGQGGATVV